MGTAQQCRVILVTADCHREGGGGGGAVNVNVMYDAYFTNPNLSSSNQKCTFLQPYPPDPCINRGYNCIPCIANAHTHRHTHTHTHASSMGVMHAHVQIQTDSFL